MVGEIGCPKESASLSPAAKAWPWKVLILVSAFMFLDQFKPSEPHLVPFLIDDKHFTNEQVANAIYPVSFYATLITNLVAAACVDYVGYKIVVLFGACARICTRLLLIYGTSLLSMQLAEVTYGIGEATLTVLTASVFFLVQPEQYQLVTSVTQAAALVSYVVSAELGQLLVDNGFSRLFLFYISLIAITLGSIVAGVLPSAASQCKVEEEDRPRALFGFEAVWDVVQTTYSQAHLQALSAWWIMGSAVTILVESYGISLFQAVDPHVDFNGHIVAITRLVSCLTSLLSIQIDKSATGIHSTANGVMTVYVFGSVLVGSACIGMGYSSSLVLAYGAYIIAVSTSQLLLCLVFVQSARLIGNGRYVLLFSLNSGASLVIQSASQALIVYFNLSIHEEFRAFGWFSVTLAACFAVVLVLFSFEQVHPDDASYNGRLANRAQSNSRSAYSSLLQSSKSKSGKARSVHNDVEANASESLPLATNAHVHKLCASDSEALC